MLPATLRTARLTLRAPGAEDADWIAREIARPEVHQMLTTPPRPYRASDAEAWLDMISGRDGAYVIGASDPVGIVDIGRGEGERELGYWLRMDAWGKGFMTEAAQALVAAWFDATDDDLVSGHLTANAASAGVLRKLGFAYEAPVMRHSGFWGREVEVLRMRLNKAGWLKRRRAGGPAR
jgi:RimJ/RimL family protein N-acetyltransferase